MESVNVLVIVAAILMIAGIVLFIKWYNNNKIKNVSEEDIDISNEDAPEEDEFEDCCSDDECVCHDTQAPVEKCNIMRITSIERVKVKTRVWLLTNGKSKQEADDILNNLSRPFDATGMDHASAPFKYEWTA